MKLIWRLLPIVLCVTAVAQNSSTITHAPIYITHVVVIDTETGREAPDQTVIVSGGKIAEIRDSGRTSVAVNASIVDGKGKYLIPGLWDMHVHTWDYESTYPLYIANGVTGVRDMFGPPDANKFRAEFGKKQLVAPHFYLASPIVDGHPKVWRTSVEVNTPAEARQFVDEQKHNGADFIKVYSRLKREEFLAIMGEAREQNISVQGHVPTAVSAWEAAAEGQKTFEHLNGVSVACTENEDEVRQMMNATTDFRQRNSLSLKAAHQYSEKKCQQLFDSMRKHGVWAVPTLTVDNAFGHLDDAGFRKDERLTYFHGEFRSWLEAEDDFRLKGYTDRDYEVERELVTEKKKLVAAMYRAGVPILAGTDVGNPFCFPGFSLHDELALLVESGLTPLAALQAATRNAAIFMNAADRYGSVSKGKIADLVLLDANPLQDIHNTTKIAEVFLNGKEFDRKALDGILRAAETNAMASDQSAGSEPPDIAPNVEMQQLSRILAGRWSGKLAREPGSRENGRADEAWYLTPGGLTLVEENRLSTAQEDSFDYAAVWWNRKEQKYQGIWCADINVEGCNGFDAQIGSDRVTMTGEWEQAGHRRAWREVFSHPDEKSLLQTLEVGEPRGELKLVSSITATKVTESAAGSPGSSEDELRAFMNQLKRANIQGDVDTVANSITDDYIQTDINGYRQDKTTWLNEYFKPLANLIKAGKFHWDEFERTNLQFRFYGSCAIVTGELHAKGTGAKPGGQHTWVPDPNASFSGTLHFTHVYINQNGKWMLAALHNQMPMPPANAAK
jgi:imidazolonepropionase-like amidohydrolase/ketosteroid isomerase-like protein